MKIPIIFLKKLINISSVGLLLSACQNQSTTQTPPQDYQIPNEWYSQSGVMHCFPTKNKLSERPIDDIELPVAPGENIWPFIQQGLAFEYVDHKLVRQQLNWYKKHPEYLQRVQQRASRYLYHIVDTLHEKEVPLDIVLLPIIESAYEPFAYSHGQASGLWQFIPMTGRRFKLEKNWWLDERRDVLQSSEAAAKYLSYLHRYFDGDWQLAVAAYNAGEGTVRKAVRKNQKKGLPIDFFSLDLPKETTAYVPKLIALSEIFKHPKKYGIQLHPIPNQPYFDQVILDSQLDLAQAAKLMDIPVEEVYYLNSGLNRWATPPSKAYKFNVPVNKKHVLIEALAKLPSSQRVNWHRYTIKSGDSLGIIAEKFDSRVDLIKEVNNLNSHTIGIGKTLMIPTASAGGQAYAYSQNSRSKKRKAKQPENYKHKTYHVVKAGDSFWSLSKRYGQTPQILAKWNAKAPKDTLRIGEKLVIWHKQPQNAFSRQPTVRKVHYKVRKGDSLSLVASRFNVKIPQIVNWNPIDPSNHLQPGQRLTLYVDVNETR